MAASVTYQLIRLVGGPAHGTTLTVPASWSEVEVPEMDPGAAGVVRDTGADAPAVSDAVPFIRHRYVRPPDWRENGEPVPFHHVDLLRLPVG